MVIRTHIIFDLYFKKIKDLMQYTREICVHKRKCPCTLNVSYLITAYYCVSIKYFDNLLQYTNIYFYDNHLFLYKDLNEFYDLSCFFQCIFEKTYLHYMIRSWIQYVELKIKRS